MFISNSNLSIVKKVFFINHIELLYALILLFKQIIIIFRYLAQKKIKSYLKKSSHSLEISVEFGANPN
jgi:hypothetical protein